MIDRSKLPNSFEFVVTAGARARQLLAGAKTDFEAGGREDKAMEVDAWMASALRR